MSTLEQNKEKYGSDSDTLVGNLTSSICNKVAHIFIAIRPPIACHFLYICVPVGIAYYFVKKGIG